VFILGREKIQEKFSPESASQFVSNFVQIVFGNGHMCVKIESEVLYKGEMITKV
jgi:hypothetical protein